MVAGSFRDRYVIAGITKVNQAIVFPILNNLEAEFFKKLFHRSIHSAVSAHFGLNVLGAVFLQLLVVIVSHDIAQDVGTARS